MPLYNQMVNTAIDIAKIADHLNLLSYEKAREDLIVQTAKMYYMAQNTAEQIRLVNDNIKRLEELYGITQAFYDNQMSLEVDVKRVKLNIENLTVQRDNAIAMLDQQYTMLKYVIDYPADKQIKVTEVNPGEIETVNANGLNTNLYELQLLEKRKELAQKQTKLALRTCHETAAPELDSVGLTAWVSFESHSVYSHYRQTVCHGMTSFTVVASSRWLRLAWRRK